MLLIITSLAAIAALMTGGKRQLWTRGPLVGPEDRGVGPPLPDALLDPGDSLLVHQVVAASKPVAVGDDQDFLARA